MTGPDHSRLHGKVALAPASWLDPSGYDACKKVKGLKRHVLVFLKRCRSSLRVGAACKRRFLHMAKRRYKSAAKQASHAPEATQANKVAVVELLGKGMGPGEAAEAVKVGRSTIYDWKKADPAFSAAWDNAVHTSHDKLEGRLYRIAMNADDAVARLAIMDILKNRKGADWNNSGQGDRVSGSQTNYYLHMPIQEHIQRLERLGLPVPVIESDSEEDYAPQAEKDRS
jgi:hypothetical protein